MILIPELETERLRLVRWHERHHARYAQMCANPRTQRFLGGVFAADDAWRRMAMFSGHWQLRGFGNWALEEMASGRLVGYSGIWRPDGFPEVELMWALHAAEEGNGYAAEAARRARAWAYGEHGIATLVSYIAADNRPSQRLAERLGASLEGTAVVRGSQVQVWRHPRP